ncbi:peptide-binding protein [Nitrosococcus wardiae]|uniref:ABC transporter substrate-binding protein n=1 Tax=Nitrosococcus wardiae TaxID=1814290 RepID=A0A4P7BZL6_9GAMM|nr:peptide-binding protein [Nitrosococcus wardiae]QBQ53972.1 ABC transporter substrate-binding protein [Nitrosococcus wardiae]
MARRFTVKDFFLFLFLSLLFILILLAMYMVDRQWLKLAEMERTLTEQAQDLRGLRDLIRSTGSGGLTLAPTESGGTADIPPAFRRAYTATQQSDYRPGDWLVQAFGTGLKTLTPLVSTDAYAAEVQGYVLETLLTRNPETLEWQGLLARDWEVSEDGLTFRFRLRKGITFSDGEPLTAEDVAFSFAFIMNPAIAAPRERAYYEKIEQVTALGPYQVEFKFKEPYFNSLALAGGLTILPQHFYGPYLQQPESFNQSKGLLLGSGPYRLQDPKGWTPDQGLVELERNPRYWGPIQPSFDKLLWKVIANDSARLTTFRNGDIDIYGARPLEYHRLLEDQALGERTQHFEYMSPTAGYSYVAWNQERDGKPTRFADKRVRQAMTFLTDRASIIEQIMLGYAEPAVSPFSPRSPQHDPTLTPRPFDLAKAKALLAQAGYADRDGDGVLEDANHQPFRFELVFFQDADDTQRLVLFLKDLYARAGILLEPKPTEWSVMLDRINKKNFDAIALGWTSGVEIDIYQMFHSSQTIPGGDNFIAYRNPELDALIEEARATVDENKRMPLWQACEHILYEDQPYTFLMRRESLLFVDQRMRNLEITRLGLNLGVTPVEWYVPEPEQKYTY